MEHYLLLDVETIDLHKRFIYDIGYIVIDENDNIITYGGFVLAQVYDNKELFATAYYNTKRPNYTKMMKGKTLKKTYVGQAFRTIKSIIKNYNIKTLYAYNGFFDIGAFNFTAKHFKLPNPLKGAKMVDIMALANHEIHETEGFKEFCIKNGYLGPKGHLKTSAENTYNYLTSQDIKEDHIGLNDCFMELEILKHIKDRKPKRKTYPSS